MELEINIQVDTLDALPSYAHFGDGGADLRTMEPIDCRPGEVVKVPTGVRVEIPYGFAGFLMSRSGQGKLRVTLANSVGLIDHQYRGEIFAQITNDGINTFRAEKFDRIAQLVLVPVVNATFKVVDKVSETARGENGFGSSGKS